MSYLIRPSAEKWTLYVKGLTGERHSFTIEKDATVRKMYRQARKALGATSAIRVALGSGQRRDIPKSDERIDTVGITNCCELYVVIQQQPDIFKVTVKYPGSIGTKVIDIAEDRSTAELYREIKTLIGVHNKTTNSKELPSIQLMYGDELVEENTDLLRGEIFDGVELEAKLITISIMVQISKMYTVNISPLSTLSQFFQKVRAVTPALKSNEQLRLIHGKTDLREDSTTLQATGIVHGTTVFAVIRALGGSDPLIHMPQICPDKTIYGVTTPSTRGCFHYGALVQHTEACKQTKCPSCSGEFCFIWSAPRQTSIQSAS